MVNPPTPRPPRLLAEAMGTGVIPAEIAAILADNSRSVRKDGVALLAEKRSIRGIHSFLAQLESGVDPVPGLERVTLVWVEPDRIVYLMHLLLSVWVDIYLTSQCMFACLGKLPAEGLPLVVDIPHEAFAERRSVHAVPRVDHATHLGGISPTDFQTKPCKKAVKTIGTDYTELRGLAVGEGGRRTAQRL